MLCPPPRGPFSYHEFSAGELSYKVKKRLASASLFPGWAVHRIKLLDDSSNTTRTYCSTTFTLPVLDLSLSSTMLFVDFMLFLGTTYIMYFYFPKLLEPFWSHLDSNTSIVICPSFCHNNSYETESIICSTYWNLQKLKNT